MKKVGVILSGCGVFDGSEIHEATLALLYLDKAGVESQCFAPDAEQLEVVDHTTHRTAEGVKRNCLTEAARIARGDIKPLSALKVDDLDALILPGGFGAAKNLCTFAVDGPQCHINPEVAAAIQEAVAHQKALGAICIAPVLVARALCDTGANPVNNRIVSTPAYMLAQRISDVATGVERLITKVVSLIHEG